MSNELVIQLATGVYDGIKNLTLADGTQVQAYYKVFNDVEVIFDERGHAWLNAANIAKLLGTDKQNIGRAIDNLRKSTHLRENSRHVINMITRVERGQSGYETELTFYDQYIVNLIAGRLHNPSQEAIDYLEWRESIIDKHQDMLHALRLQAMQANHQLQSEVESLEETVQGEKKATREADFWKWKREEQLRFLMADTRHDQPIDNWTD